MLFWHVGHSIVGIRCDRTKALRCRWRSPVSWGSSVWPLGRRRPNLRPPAGESETGGRRRFPPWLRPRWRRKNKQNTVKKQSWCYSSEATGGFRGGRTRRGPRSARPWCWFPPSPGWAVRRCCWWDCPGSASGGRGSASPPEQSRPVEKTQRGRTSVTTSPESKEIIYS